MFPIPNGWRNTLKAGPPKLFLALAVGAILTMFYFSLASRSTQWVDYSYPNLNDGDISPQRIVSPFEFNVPKSNRQLELERKAATQGMLPVFTFDRAAYDSISAQVDTLITSLAAISGQNTVDIHKLAQVTGVAPILSVDTADSLIRFLQTANTKRLGQLRRTMTESFRNLSDLLIVSSNSYLERYADSLFVLENGDTIRVAMTITVPEAADMLDQSFRKAVGRTISAPITGSLSIFMQQFVAPNLTYNNQLTARNQDAASSLVPIDRASFRKNELIIDANVPVNRDQIEIVDTLKREVARRYFLENRLRHYAVAGGRSLIGLGLIGFLGIFLALNRRQVFSSFSKLLLIATIALLPITIGFSAAYSGTISSFVAPAAVASILMTILFDAEIGLMVTMIVSMLIASFFPGIDFRLFLVYFLGGAAGVFTVGHVRHRREFYRSMIAIPATIAAVIIATQNWVSGTSVTGMGYDLFFGALNGFFCPIIAIGLLPVLETVFKITTDITLLELSDLNTPLLREVAVKAPGTFSSVVVVGMLAEAAAEKVGANPLLCRVGAYYHDIGKIQNPEYYIENQSGIANPHDRLSPHMSALILSSHVKDGYELGVKYGLPEAVLDIIRQHHGTSLMQSFYHKALGENPESHLDETNFRYPGPKPQTRESAIVMLADLSEAVGRTIREKSPGRLRTLINTTIQQRYLEGELDESDLTLKDLHLIEESFLPILVSSHHSRIEYPWQQKQKENKTEEKRSGPRKPRTARRGSGLEKD